MLHAAAMLSGLWALWLLFTQRWTSGVEFALGFAVALVCVVWAARFGGVERNAFVSAPRMLALALRRSPDVLAGGWATLRAAIAADVTLAPALVRVKPRPASENARAALSGMISAASGAIVVEADAEGLLVHVIDEEAIDAAHLGALEARVLSALGQGANP